MHCSIVAFPGSAARKHCVVRATLCSLHRPSAPRESRLKKEKGGQVVLDDEGNFPPEMTHQ